MRVPIKVCTTLIIAGLLSGCGELSVPETATSPVRDDYHGVAVVDPYRWLEDWDDPAVRAWSESQNAYARAILKELPHVAKIRRRVEEITLAESVSYFSLAWGGDRLFALKHQPPLQQPLLVVMDSADAVESERVILDVNKIDASGGTSVDWYLPSPDGKLAAVSLSVGGSESGDVHIYDTQTGGEVDEVIVRVNGGTAGGDAAWTADGKGLFYTRYPRTGERGEEDMNFYQQLWYHKLGTPAGEDKYELGKDFPRIAEIQLEANHKTGRLLVTMQYGDSGKFAHYIREANGDWKQLTRYEDQVVQASFAPDGTLFLISRQEAPRGKILKLGPGDLALERAVTVVEEGEDTIVSYFYDGARPMVPTASKLYVTYQLGGPSTIRVFSHNGEALAGPDVLEVSSVGQIVPLGGDEILYNNYSYIDAPAWYRFDPGADPATVKTALVTESPVDFSDCEVVREFAVSKDGTKVPVNIIRRKGVKLDGSNPVLLNGYGGYGINLTPRYLGVYRVWIEQGGVYAVANLRGGGEYGEQWHRAGMLTKKQNVFDDFAAAMQLMIDRDYTNPDKLAIIGGSNGGLLMGAMITQHPELFQATVSAVGIYDMLRVELSPNGAFNIPEFGTVKNPDHFQALYAYSPYHNIKDGTAYPAVLFMTGANDPRVDPMQSRKMTARLQAASASGAPILLRTTSNTGHGGSTPLKERIEERAAMFAFLFDELGMEYEESD